MYSERGIVSRDFNDRATELYPYQSHLKGDRAAWGALLTSIVNQWDKSPAHYRTAAREDLRFVTFDAEVGAKK